MKLICLAVIVYALPLFAQEVCEYKSYVDSVHGFSMKIPQNQKIKIFSAGKEYIANESDNIKYKFFVKTKRKFIDDILRGYRGKLNVESDDSILAVTKIKCYNKYTLRLTGVTSFFKTDSLIQWKNDNALRIIEFQRTRVFEQPDGLVEYEEVGPLFFVIFNNIKGDFVLYFDFYNYKSESDYNIANKIVSSVKLIE